MKLGKVKLFAKKAAEAYEKKVWHAACWEAKVHKMAEIFCDEYCRFPREIKDPDALEDKCNDCKLISLLNMGL